MTSVDARGPGVAHDCPHLAALRAHQINATRAARRVPLVVVHEQDLGTVRRPPGSIGRRHPEIELVNLTAVCRRDQEAGDALEVCGDQELLAVRREVVTRDADESVGRDLDRLGPVGADDIYETRQRVAVGPLLEREAGAVARPARIEVLAGTGPDDCRRHARHGVDRVNVAVRRVGDKAIRSRPERRRQARPRACDEQGRADDDDQQDDRHREHSQWSSRQERQTCRRSGHWEPPFRERPGGPLAHPGGSSDDVVSVVGLRAHRDLRQQIGEVLLEPSLGRHAGCPPANRAGLAGRSRTVVRIAASA